MIHNLATLNVNGIFLPNSKIKIHGYILFLNYLLMEQNDIFPHIAVINTQFNVYHGITLARIFAKKPCKRKIIPFITS